MSLCFSPSKLILMIKRGGVWTRALIAIVSRPNLTIYHSILETSFYRCTTFPLWCHSQENICSYLPRGLRHRVWLTQLFSREFTLLPPWRLETPTFEWKENERKRREKKKDRGCKLPLVQEQKGTVMVSNETREWRHLTQQVSVREEQSKPTHSCHLSLTVWWPRIKNDKSEGGMQTLLYTKLRALAHQ